MGLPESTVPNEVDDGAENCAMVNWRVQKLLTFLKLIWERPPKAMRKCQKYVRGLNRYESPGNRSWRLWRRQETINKLHSKEDLWV